MNMDLQPRANTSLSRSVRRQLSLFGLALALPILAFVGILLWSFASAERGRVEREALQTARSISVAVDRELTGLRAALDMLSISAHLQSGNLQAFHSQMSEIERRQGIIAVLRDVSGQQLVNVGQPWGTPLPEVRLPVDRKILDTKEAQVSDLFVGKLTQKPLFTVGAPVVREGEVVYLLNLSVEAERIRRVVLDEHAPANWTVSVVDRGGVILARNNRNDEFVGKTATADLLANTNGPEGTWSGFTIDGTRVFGAYARSKLSDWRVAVGVREANLNAPLYRSLGLFAAIGAVLMLLSTLLAYWFGRHIAEPIRALADSASALGRGEPVAPLATPLREANQVGLALAAASEALQERQSALLGLTATLEQRVVERTIDLQAANERLRAEASERERLEGQLRQAQKMEAVGRLTGGVAHDFNNLLTIVVGNIEMLQRRLSNAETRVHRGLENALAGATRAATLTHRLLAFSRQQPLDPQPIDVNALVTGMSDLLRRTLGEDVAVETVLGDELWRVSADANQLESALLNLAVNARDAMAEGGRLEIQTGNVSLDDAYALAKGDVSPGQYVMVAVTDTGSGMPAEVAAQVFEPFFTTKPVGKGTGLGLSQVYGFVKQSGGHVAIESAVGVGTTVKVYLPRLRHGRDGTRTEVAASSGAIAMSARGETVLVVEDEDMVRRFSVEALEEAGYRVLDAAAGPRGLALLESHAEIALLFIDVVLAGPLNGRKLADEALRLRPGLKVLFTTGYTRNSIVHDGRLDPGVQFIGKPFTAAELTARVRHLLEEPCGA